jgi:hypothetical protein
MVVLCVAVRAIRNQHYNQFRVDVILHLPVIGPVLLKSLQCYGIWCVQFTVLQQCVGRN